MGNDVMSGLRLSAAEIAGLKQRLECLSSGSARMPELAYADPESKWDGCGCKGSCMGGCTSW